MTVVTLQLYKLERCFDCLAECWLLTTCCFTLYFGSAVFLTFLPASALRVLVSLWRLRFCWSCFCLCFSFLFSDTLPHTRRWRCASLIFVFVLSSKVHVQRSYLAISKNVTSRPLAQGATHQYQRQIPWLRGQF